MIRQLILVTAALGGLVLMTGAGTAAGTTTGHWTFEGGALAAPDVSDLSNDGTIYNGKVEPGYRGNAIAFNGTRRGELEGNEMSTYVAVGDPADGNLDLGVETWSLDLHLKTDDVKMVTPVLVAKGADGGPGYTIKLDGGYAVIALRDAEGDSVFAQSRSPVNDGDWHHVVASNDGNVLRLCIDAAPMTEVTIPNTLGSLENAVPFTIGAQIGADGLPLLPFAGLIDEVKVVKGDVLCQEDMTPPVLTCSITPAYLWPLNQVMVQIFVSLTITDGESGPAYFDLVSVTSNEADSQLFDGDKNEDIVGWNAGTADLRGTLRAERSGPTSTRVYTLTYEGFDVAGNSSLCTLEVRATHERPSDMENSHLDDGYPIVLDPRKLR